jgi:hypothetical protein
MKVRNETVYRTDHLKAILQKAAEQELEPDKRKQLIVTVSYTRGAHSSGCAYIKGRHATVRIQHPQTRSRRWKAATTPELALHFASVAVHEFAHIRGMRHAGMPNYYRWSGKWREYVAWAADFPLTVKEEPMRPTVTVTDKLTHVLAMKARAEARVKRATTILRKWKMKERYYVKAAQKTAQTTDPPKEQA